MSDYEMGGQVKANRSRSNEVSTVVVVLSRMFPAQQKRLNKLKDIVRSWKIVVGEACGKNSAPYDLVGKTLYVASSSPLVTQQLSRMKGNIQRKIKARWDLDVDDVKVTKDPLPVKQYSTWRPPVRSRPRVTVTNEEVAAIRETLPNSLTPEAADALAHLRAFFNKRFPENNQS